MRLPFVISGYRHRDLPVSAQRVVNLFSEAEPQQAKAPVVLLPTPGLTPWVDLSQPRIRGMNVMGEYLYVVAGSGLYRVSTTAEADYLGTIDGEAPVSMDDNGTQMVICAPDVGIAYAATASTLAQITDGDFPAAVTSVAYLDGYHVVSERDSGRFWWSALNSATAWDALDFATAEGAPDNLVRLIRVGRELWLFGERSTEIWANSGSADSPFQRISGAFVDRGCIARASIAARLGRPFWLGDDKIVYSAQGIQPQRISTHAIEQAIAGYEDVTDARGFVYEQEGHSFYVLTFPGALATWVYDIDIGVWHERTSGRLGVWRVAEAAAFGGLLVGGDARTGRLWLIDPTANDEDGDAIIRVAVGQTMHEEAKRVQYRRFVAEFVTGNAPLSGQGSDPKVWLRWSDDGARTWSNEKWAGLGATGKYRSRAKWDRLGQARERVFWLQWSDPVRATLMAVNVDAEPAAS